jgi:acyl-CoA synthetase (AMP-forming)/AMP-acid ligase II
MQIYTGQKTNTNANIARLLPEMARERPEQIAVVTGAGRDANGKVIYKQWTFAELDRRSDAYAWGLTGYGFEPGMRVLLLVPAGLPLIALTFALFKVGCVPILIDPAMGTQNLAVCIAECQPDAMIGVARAHLARLVFRKAFRTVRRHVTAGRWAAWGGATLDDLYDVGATITTPFPMAEKHAGDPAAIVFTTGSTGVPKGVLYEYGMFNAQCRMLQEFYGVQPGEIDMPAFPLFALFNVALGVTSVIPPIDPTRPAACDPAKVVETIHDQHVTMSFGSPAIWDKVSRYCVEHGVRLPTLRRVLMAGAPVPARIHERFMQIIEPDANTFTPYGATEALPVSSISGRELLALRAERPDPTAGTCVGRPVTGVELRIIRITDDAIPAWSDDLVLPPGEVGEITVSGPAVTKEYINRPESTRLAKIQDGGRVWHRMGDLGYLDDEERVWFYGRKVQRVETADGPLFTEPCELVFNQHPDVFRSALVGIQTKDEGRRTKENPAQSIRHSSSVVRPVMIIEPHADKFPRTAAERERFEAELLALGAAHQMTASIQTVLFHRSFPVDIRHNAKIFREKLAAWAQQELA